MLMESGLINSSFTMKGKQKVKKKKKGRERIPKQSFFRWTDQRRWKLDRY